MTDIHRLLDEAFAGATMTPELQDLKEELRGNLASRVSELQGKGMDASKAASTAVAELDPDVIQFIGHGRYDDAEEQGRIALVDETGRADWVGEAALAQILGDVGDMPRLVFLHSCSGAQTDYRASFAGIAPRLIRRGTQCVVAMQYAVTNRMAVAFSQGFYRGLADRLPLDEAVQAGRRSLSVHYERDPRLLGIPVVYLNSRDARLLAPAGEPGSSASGG